MDTLLIADINFKTILMSKVILAKLLQQKNYSLGLVTFLCLSMVFKSYHFKPLGKHMKEAELVPRLPSVLKLGKDP